MHARGKDGKKGRCSQQMRRNEASCLACENGSVRAQVRRRLTRQMEHTCSVTARSGAGSWDGGVGRAGLRPMGRGGCEGGDW